MYSGISTNGHLEDCGCHNCHADVAEIMDRIRLYPGEESALMHAVPQCLFENIDRLPKALQASARIIFTPHGTNIGAKYGVRDYFRQISTTRVGKESTCLKVILSAYAGKHPPIKTMMNLLQGLQKNYVYEINVDYQKHHHRPHGEIVTLAPVALSMTVFKDEGPYQEQVAMLTTEHMQIRRRDAEHIGTMLPYGFSEHALKRLWERASLNGDTFHQVMADAFRVMRDRIAMAYIAYVGEGLEVPSYLAIPFYDGLIIAGKRRCWTENMQRRYGYKVSHGELELLSHASPLFGEAPQTHISAGHMGSIDWLAGTYMAAKDISNPDRMDAAEEYEAWSESQNEGVMPYLCERFESAPRAEIDSWMPEASRKRFIDLQARMQPRVDPLDERIYVYGKLDLDFAKEAVKIHGSMPPPDNLPY